MLSFPLQKRDSSTSTSATGGNMYLYVLMSTFFSFGVYVQYFLDAVGNQTSHSNRVIRKRFMKRICHVNVT